MDASTSSTTTKLPLEDEAEEDSKEKEFVFDVESHSYVEQIYKESFVAKLELSSDENKKFYEILKNEILFYTKEGKHIFHRISWCHELFSVSSRQIAKLKMKEGSLWVYLNLNETQASSYPQFVRSTFKMDADTPFKLEIQGEEQVNIAKAAISTLMDSIGFEMGLPVYFNYVDDLSDDNLETLIEKGLVRLVETTTSPTISQKKYYTSMTREKAETLLSDEEAQKLIQNGKKFRNSTKNALIYTDLLCLYFNEGEYITLDKIRKRIPGFPGTSTCLEVLARGTLNKALLVEADAFSLDAVKMIVLTGGKVFKTRDQITTDL